MANEPIYFLSGFDNPDTLPKSTEALLRNGPSILISSNSTSIKQHHNFESLKYSMIDSGGKQIFRITSGKKTRFEGFISDPEKPVHYKGFFNWTTEHWKRSILKTSRILRSA